MTLTEKINKACEKEFDLTLTEVRKIIKAANRRNKIMTATVDGWFTAGCDKQTGFQTVECTIIDGLTEERLDDVVIECCMFDRRMSFVQKTIDEIK
jgi:hypothetical protein